ncbi:Iron-sulfur clusters incorporation protein [Toensbergia leucococca]|nr:Iron-sulfur clusters incorporation protein [Toensbergia leucococca]
MLAPRPSLRLAPLCSSCRRLLSNTPSPPPPTAFAKLTTRRLIALTGQDAAHFLQGLITQNIRPSAQTGIYSAFLNAQGRVLHDVFIYPASHSPAYRETLKEGTDAGFLIEADAGEVERLAGHLKRFKLRAKVGVRVLGQGEWGVWSAWDEGERWVKHGIGEETDIKDGGIGCVDLRAPGMGRRVVLPGENVPESSGQEVGVEQYSIRRILRGVAEGQGEIGRETALPLESNVDYMGGIDFRKGCYVGQELTIRTHHTGVVRKRILPVQIYGDSVAPERMEYEPLSRPGVPPQGTNVTRVGAKGRSAGKWIGGIGNIGLALCRLEVMTDVVLTEGSDWTPEREFKFAWEGEHERESGEVKVKAFVPSWHRNRISVRDVQRERNT